MEGKVFFRRIRGGGAARTLKEYWKERVLGINQTTSILIKEGVTGSAAGYPHRLQHTFIRMSIVLEDDEGLNSRETKMRTTWAYVNGTLWRQVILSCQQCHLKVITRPNIS